jgi:hypothetical protein
METPVGTSLSAHSLSLSLPPVNVAALHDASAQVVVVVMLLPAKLAASAER